MIQFRLPAKPARPLPVIATVKQAWHLLLEHRRLQIKLMIAPFILLTVAGALQYRISNYFVTEDNLTPEKMVELAQQIPLGLKLGWMVTALVGTALLMAFSVAWRRFLLLKETPPVFYFQRPFWRYLALGTSFLAGLFGLLILASLISSVVSVGLGITNVQTSIYMALFCLLLALLVFVVWIVRHILLFTAVTVDNRGLTWSAAAEAMQGNGLLYSLVWLILIVPISLANMVLAYLLVSCGVDLGTTVGAMVFAGLQAVVSLIQFSLGSSLGALVYDFLLRGGGPAGR